LTRYEEQNFVLNEGERVDTTGRMVMVSGLSRLAWCTVVGSHSAVTYHGPFVENQPGWLSEGVWDDDFSADGLATASTISGSGAIVQDESARFFTATNLVDRILVAKSDTRVIVSNSLPLILAVSGARLLPDHSYTREYSAILAGINTYNPNIPLDGEGWNLRHYYYGVIAVDFHTLDVTFTRYRRSASFESFEQYSGMLESTTQRIASNATDGRRQRAVELVTTLSRGYDSTAVSTLAARAGVKKAYLRKRSASIWPSVFRHRVNDDGSVAAHVLGFDVVPVPDSPSGDYCEQLEAAMLASSPTQREMVYLPMAVSLHKSSKPTAVFMGYNGDHIWGVATSEDRYAAVADDIIRSDISGLTHAEVRLVAGFVIVPLSFVGAEGIASLRAISRSSIMKPWSVGGDYDRPIARRIAEEAGIPRSAFGVRKQAVCGHLGQLAPKHPMLRKSFRREIRPMHDRLAKWQYRGARAVNIAQIRLMGHLIRQTTKPNWGMPHWYARRSVAIFHAAVTYLIDHDVDVLEAAGHHPSVFGSGMTSASSIFQPHNDRTCKEGT
jgi:hypothetical protein